MGLFLQDRNLGKVKPLWYYVREARGQSTRAEVSKTKIDILGRSCCNKLEPGLETYLEILHTLSDSISLMSRKLGGECEKEEATYRSGETGINKQ